MVNQVFSISIHSSESVEIGFGRKEDILKYFEIFLSKRYEGISHFSNTSTKKESVSETNPSKTVRVIVYFQGAYFKDSGFCFCDVSPFQKSQKYSIF